MSLLWPDSWESTAGHRNILWWRHSKDWQDRILRPGGCILAPRHCWISLLCHTPQQLHQQADPATAYVPHENLHQIHFSQQKKTYQPRISSLRYVIPINGGFGGVELYDPVA
ncbi:hypothetical protein GGI43DRAFT_384219 [Trichoderma evansii]